MSEKLSEKNEKMSHNEKKAYADALNEKLSFSDTFDLINKVRLQEEKTPLEYFHIKKIIWNYKLLYKNNFFEIDNAKDSIKRLIHDFEDDMKRDNAKILQIVKKRQLTTTSKKIDLSQKEKMAYVKALKENLSFLDTCNLINETRRQEQKEALVFPYKCQIIRNYRDLDMQNLFGLDNAKNFIRKIDKEYNIDFKRDIARRRDKKRKMGEWNKIRKKILLRDNYTCQICGSETTLHVHHIVPFSLVNCHNTDNLVTLCSTCHDNIHSINSFYGVRGSKKFVKNYINLCKKFNLKATLEQDDFEDFFYFTYETIS